MEKNARIEELVRILNRASEDYYNDRDESMSNFEWDQLFDELTKLEEATGYILPDSPTQNAGYEESIGEGEREAHEYPALSLAKSKNAAVLQKWAGTRPVWLSWKLDGITLVATFDGGKLTRLLTRGNGQTGTNITYLAPYVKGLPQKITYKGHLVVRGEATISYDDFNRLNDTSEDPEEQYANPRNLVAGTLALDSKRASEVRERCVTFNAFTLVHTDEEIVSWGERMELLKKMKFTVVDHELTDAQGLPAAIERWTAVVRSGKMDLPVDGLVICYDDTIYAASGSVTGHHATNAGMAFKWQDTSAETTLDHIEWSCATNAITPVAVFDMVRLEGTEVRRASLCNVSELRRLGIGEDRKTSLTVIKSNMIIPKCIKADAHGTTFTIPEVCPVCGEPTEVRVSDKTGVETLHCTNADCTAKQLNKYIRFVSKPGLDIDGLSGKTLMKFINEGFVSDFADLYDIEKHSEAIIAMEGYGKRAFAKLLASIEARRTVPPVNFIFALSIPMIGEDAAKKFISACGTKGFFERLGSGAGFEDIEGIGPEKSTSVIRWYEEEKNRKLMAKLLERISVQEVAPVSREEKEAGRLSGLTFVITGDVHTFKNRAEFKDYVEKEGGKVAGSVSKKTDFLVNNDNTSTSGKNQKAKELAIPILTEDEFIARFGH